MYDKYNGRCFYFRDLVGNNWHIDHRIPIAAGGNNEDENLILSCAQCNECKNDKIFSSQYQFYINDSSEIVGTVRPYQLVRKQKNIDQDVYLTLYTNSSNGYSNRTSDGYQRIAEWNWRYENELTKLTDSEAKLIIKYHNLLLKKVKN
ncbi:HNH endonuclease signature motif containing protein [Lactobacillus amylovorus]|uniref:HNH endonuclease n=1 Tax=Lactobacillus amylovorus TaxID=1604 RepID=UPI0030C6C5C1